jgi:hypothetical protein
MNTVEQFRTWATSTNRMFTRDGSVSHVNRDWAKELRPFDPVLADLYVKMAEANEAIRAHLAKRVE